MEFHVNTSTLEGIPTLIILADHFKVRSIPFEGKIEKLFFGGRVTQA